MKTIALDYDGTYTTAPEMWDRIIQIWQETGFRVLCVTCREDTEENVEEVVVPGCSVVFTKRSPKDWFMKQRRQISVDIWVDNDPAAILHGR